MRKTSTKTKLVAIVSSVAARSVLLPYLIMKVTTTESLASLPPLRFHHLHQQQSFFTTKKSTSLSAVHVWVEEAEEGFVDEDENLMMGEVCLRAVKAFAGTVCGKVNDKDESMDTVTTKGIEDKRLLCAGALVQRPPPSASTGRDGDSNADVGGLPLCDVWMADGYMDETNLQFQGALLVLDDLLYHHLKRNTSTDRYQCCPSNTNSNKGSLSTLSMVHHSMEEILSTFIVQCGSAESDYHFASHRAVKARGFKSLKEFPTSNSEKDDHIPGGKEVDSQTTMTLPSSSYCWKYLKQEEEDLDAFMLDMNDINYYLENPSSPENIVQLLKQIKRIEEDQSIFQ